MKLPIKDVRKPINDTEEKLGELYHNIISFFEKKMGKLDDKLEDAGIKKKSTAPGIILGTLAGLLVGAAAASKLPLDDIKLPKVNDLKVPVKETGKKAKQLFSNVSSFIGNKLHNVEDKMEDVGIIEKKNTGPGIFLGIISGLVLGAIAALLLTKDTGEDFRKKIKKNFNETKEKLIAKKDETLHFAKKETENIKNAASAQTEDFTHHS